MNVTLEQAQWLKEQGYPQDLRVQRLWGQFDFGGKLSEWELCWPLNDPEDEPLYHKACAAPHPIDALDWLEREKAVDWHRRQRNSWVNTYVAIVVATALNDNDPGEMRAIYASTPLELLDKIMAAKP